MNGHDTTVLEFSQRQVDTLIKEIKPQSPGFLSPGAIALLAALIGALSAIGSQLLIFNFGARKEKYRLRRELIAEERSLAVLLVEFYKELAWLKVNYEFWYRGSHIGPDKMPYEQFLLVRDKIPECKRSINSSLSAYFKAVMHFVTVTPRSDAITTLLNQIKDLPVLKEESETFQNVNDFATLNTRSAAESERLKKEYMKLGDHLDTIYATMIAALKK